MTRMSSFDYIIIGGGSAGCVLANRLSAVPNTSVCMLEAGPRDTNPFIRVPLGLIITLNNKKLNWQSSTIPQIHCNNRRIDWPMGRTLGGSSAINAMCFVRGNAKDYDQWAALGNEGWSYKDVLPWFKKMENFEPEENEFHGKAGPMNVAKARSINPLTVAFIEAALQAGYLFNPDYNGETQEGASYFFVAQKDGYRWSNADAYLNPVKHRKNLTIITDAHVCKILFKDKRAVGVRFLKSGKTEDIFVNKEVLLSAGAVGSPRILLLSGVGPRAEIEKHGIALVQDLPGVGENLQDHLNISIATLEKTHTAINFGIFSLWRSLCAAYQYLFKKQGEFTTNGAEGVAFSKSSPNLLFADIQWHFVPSIVSEPFDLMPGFKYFGYNLMACHLHPHSRGHITLESADPQIPPRIDPNYLAEKDDLEVMVTAFKKTREILAQKAFEPYRLREYEPGGTVQSDEQIREYIRRCARSIYHPVGTCKMGHDDMAVVEPSTLKVYGLENVRVIDASVMPTITSGNTNAPTTMIAERGAAMILERENDPISNGDKDVIE